MEEERAPCTAELILGWMEERIWAIRASWETWLLLETRALRREFILVFAKNIFSKPTSSFSWSCRLLP